MGQHAKDVPTTEHAYIAIRNSIIENTLPHGSRITIRGMAEYTECQSLKRALDRINLFRLLQKTRERVALSHVQLPRDLHMSVVKAIMSRDSDATERQMREHISVSTRGWLNLP
jgi:DNA-binding GntR family transcriptional regulator